MSIVHIAIWAVVIIVALSVLALIVFGIRALTYGKVQPVSAAMILVPGVIFLIMGLIMQGGEYPWERAAMWTLVITLGLTLAAMLFTSVRSLFT